MTAASTQSLSHALVLQASNKGGFTKWFFLFLMNESTNEGITGVMTEV